MNLFERIILGLLSMTICGCTGSDSPPLSINSPSSVKQSDDFTSLPDLGSEYRIDPYIAYAIRLQKMGRDAACQELLEVAKNDSKQLKNRQIAILCRMLFCKRTNSSFTRPGLGGAHFLGGSNYSDWQLEPIELIDGAPFAISTGYTILGRAESGLSYLNYCIANCDWNSFLYRELQTSDKRTAMAKLLTSDKWNRPLNEYEQGFLAAQIR